MRNPNVAMVTQQTRPCVHKTSYTCSSKPKDIGRQRLGFHKVFHFLSPKSEAILHAKSWVLAFLVS